MGTVSIEQFIEFLSLELDLGGQPLLPDTDLRQDLALDSLDALRIAAGIEVEYGVLLPEELLAEITSVADLHHYVNLAVERGGPEPGS